MIDHEARNYPTLRCRVCVRGVHLSGLRTRHFPPVDQATQKARDDTRRQILQTELATEKKALDGAQQALADAINAKQPTAKLDPLRQEAERHAKNVNALNGELTALGKLPAAAKASTPVRLSGRTINSAPNATQPAPFWDVYKRAQVKAGDAPESPESQDSP